MQTRLISFITLACVTIARAALFTAPEHLPKDKQYDYIVIGSGPGGGTISARLSEDPKVNVLMIEAGARADDDINVQVPLFAHRLQQNSPYDWNYTTVAQRGLNDRILPYSRGKAVGGTSILNWMYWVRGPRDDYDKFAAVTGDWRWSWAALQHLWKKNERFVSPRDHHNTAGEIDPDIHGKHGAVQISIPGATFPTDNPTVAASKELGGEFQLIEDYNSGNPLGIGWFQGAYGGGERRDSANSYIDPALSRGNLDVLIQTQVTKLVRTGTKENVPVIRGVEFAQSRSAPRYTLTANREVILSAGAINTPQLLLLSGIGPSAQLAAHDIRTIVDLPDVGQHLADHPVIPLPYSTVSAADDIFTNLARNATFFDATLAEWKMRRQGVATNSDTNHIAFLRLSRDDPVFSTQPDPASGPTAPHTEFFVIPGTFQFLGPVPPEGGVTVFGGVVVSPSSRGNVTLASSDPFTAPHINPNFLSTPFDVAAMRSIVRAVQRFAAARAWSAFLAGPTGGLEHVRTDRDADVDAWARDQTITIWHPTGTAAMAGCGSAAGGVVNPDLTVKGVEGLRVVDASVFPFIPAGHPQAVVYVFAERAAEIIKSGYSACL